MKKLKNMTRVGFEPQTSHLVAYVLHRYATEAAGMMDLSRLYKTGKHVVVSSRSVIGCRVYTTWEVTVTYMAAVYAITFIN